jgi:hypothetical protein
MPFDVQGALKAGYSIDEIGGHVGFDVAGAKQAGYSDDEIMGHLSGSAVSKPSVQPPKEKGFISKRLDAVSNPTPSAVRDFSPTLGSVLNVAGQAGGTVMDTIGAGLKKGYDLLPESVQGAIKHGASRITDNPLVDAAGTLFKATPEGVQNDIGRIADASMIVPGVQLGRIGLKGAKEGVNIARDVGTILSKPIKKELSSVVEKGIEKGVRPTVVGKRTATQVKNYYDRAKSAVTTIIDNKDALVLTDSAGNEIKGSLPRNLKQFAESIEQTKKGIYQKYHGMATEAGEQGSLFDTTTIINKLDDVSGDLKHNPEIRKYADSLKTEISELHGQPPDIIEARIADLNSSLNGFYEGRVSRAKAQVDASVANLMREELDNKIMNAAGPGYKDLKKQYGALKGLEKEVNHRAIVDARKNTKGLSDLTDVFTQGEILAGALTMNPAMIARGAAGKGIKEYYKYLNSPNRIVKNMFGDAEKILNKSTQPEMRSSLGKILTPNAETLQKGDLGTLRYGNRLDQNAGMALGPVKSGVTVGQPYGENIGRIVPQKQLPAGQGFELQGAPTSPDIIDAHFTSTSRPIPALDIPRRDPTLALPNGQGFEMNKVATLKRADQPRLRRPNEPVQQVEPIGDFYRQAQVRLKEQADQAKFIDTPEGKFALELMQQQLRSGNAGLLMGESESGLKSVTGRFSSHAQWFRDISHKHGVSAKETDNIIKKYLNGEKLTDRQSRVFNDIRKSSIKEGNNSLVQQYSEVLKRTNEQAKSELKEAGVNAGEIEGNRGDIETALTNEIRSAGNLTAEQEEAALKEISSFFDEMGSKAQERKKIKTNAKGLGELTTGTIKGI